MLLGLLWPDPCDPLCPKEFRDEARKLLRQVAGCNPGTTDEDLRKALLKFIADFANWDLTSNRSYLDVSRALVKAAHGEEPPLVVVDPFAGGGSIPLEALRLGCEAFASDLNPVAYLILRTVLENDVSTIDSVIGEFEVLAELLQKQVRKVLDQFYPHEPEKETLGYFWARTVQCETPACGAEIPLLKSFWLMSGRTAKAALRYRVIRQPNLDYASRLAGVA